MESILTQRFKMKNSDSYMFVEHPSDPELFSDYVNVCSPYTRRVYGDDFTYVEDKGAIETKCCILYNDDGRAYFLHQNETYYLDDFDHMSLPDVINMLKNDKLYVSATDLRWALVYGGIHKTDFPGSFLVYDRERDPDSYGRVTPGNMVPCKCIDASNLLVNKDDLQKSGWITLQAVDGTFAKSFYFSDLASDINYGFVELCIPEGTTWDFSVHAHQYMKEHLLSLFGVTPSKCPID